MEKVSSQVLPGSLGKGGGGVGEGGEKNLGGLAGEEIRL